MTTIAFLGLGNMGAPMAGNLVNAGYAVRGFDPVPAAARGRRRARASTSFATGAEAVDGADVVITIAAQRDDGETAATPRSLPAAAPGALFIDTSTISVDDARAVHAYAADAGLAQLDAPVSGGIKGATAGTLAFMVGGEAEALERARPVLEPMAGKIIHCGDSGAGQAAKLCNNMVLAVQQIADRRGVRSRREARPVRAVAVRRDHRRDRQLLGGAHELPCARSGSDVAGQQRLQARVRHRADEQGPGPGDERGVLHRRLGAAGHATPPRSTPRSPPSTATWTSARSSKPCAEVPPASRRKGHRHAEHSGAFASARG